MKEIFSTMFNDIFMKYINNNSHYLNDDGLTAKITLIQVKVKLLNFTIKIDWNDPLRLLATNTHQNWREMTDLGTLPK